MQRSSKIKVCPKKDVFKKEASDHIFDWSLEQGPEEILVDNVGGQCGKTLTVVLFVVVFFCPHICFFRSLFFRSSSFRDFIILIDQFRSSMDKRFINCLMKNTFFKVIFRSSIDL